MEEPDQQAKYLAERCSELSQRLVEANQELESVRQINRQILTAAKLSPGSVVVVQLPPVVSARDLARFQDHWRELVMAGVVSQVLMLRRDVKIGTTLDSVGEPVPLERVVQEGGVVDV